MKLKDLIKENFIGIKPINTFEYKRQRLRYTNEVYGQRRRAERRKTN